MRTAGVWLEDGHVLLESLANAELWGIPGGGLEPDESVEEGCLREYREELGLEMRTDGLALINENFWRETDEIVREYCFYFWVLPEADAPHGRPEVSSKEDELRFRWFRLEELPSIDFVPPFLKAVLPTLSSQTMFLTTVEE